MNFLNASIPGFEALLRAEFLYNGEKRQGEFIPVYVFGISSVEGRAVGFHVMTDSGAVFWRVPVHALAWKEDAPSQPLDHLELWDCFSPNVSVTEFDFLFELRCAVRLKDGKIYPGTYKFTIDWTGNRIADDPGNVGHKCAHLIQLDNGNFALQPNNRIRWFEPSFVTAPFKPDYKTNTRIWKVENKGWKTEDSDRFFYEVEANGSESPEPSADSSPNHH